MEKASRHTLTIIDEDEVYEEVKAFIKSHGYKKITSTQFVKMYHTLCIKKESITKKRYSLWFHKKTEAGYHIVLTATFDDHEEVKKSFLYFAVFSGNRLLKSQELSKEEVSIAKLESLEGIFINIPHCPDCKKMMHYRNSDSYLCDNFKKHTPGKCITISIHSHRIKYITLTKKSIPGKSFKIHQKHVSVVR